VKANSELIPRPTVICPDGHKRAQPYTWTVVRKPDTHSHRVVVIFHTQLDASLRASGCLGSVRDVKDVGDTTHEGHGARPRVEVADFALEVFDLWLPWLGGSGLQCLFELFWGEAIANGGAGRLLCWRRSCQSRVEERLYRAVLVRVFHGVAECFEWDVCLVNVNM
jgi:hypothetical protein